MLDSVSPDCDYQRASIAYWQVKMIVIEWQTLFDCGSMDYLKSNWWANPEIVWIFVIEFVRSKVRRRNREDAADPLILDQSGWEYSTRAKLSKRSMNPEPDIEKWITSTDYQLLYRYNWNYFNSDFPNLYKVLSVSAVGLKLIPIFQVRKRIHKLKISRTFSRGGEM